MKKYLEEVNLQKEFNNAMFTLLVSYIGLSIHAVLAMPLSLCQRTKPDPFPLLPAKLASAKTQVFRGCCIHLLLLL